MTPSRLHTIPKQFKFEPVKSSPVIVNFTGKTVTSDAGLTLIAELDRKREITSRLAACFKDYREQNRIEHSLLCLIAQRVYGLVMGYEDINDHEILRHDMMFALAVGKAINAEEKSITLAGKSTLNRIEHCPEDVSSMADSRYHRIEHDPKAIETLLVEIFLESYSKPPRQITIDLDVTDDLIHGNQEEGFFNPYYKGYCYAPLYLFCDQHLLAAKLRASNSDPAGGALEELQRVIKQIRTSWPNVKILVRGDSAYAREDIMVWCESEVNIDYVFGLAQNNRLLQLTYSTRYRASEEYLRGNMENSLKEQKLDLKSDRTSTHTFAGNQLRLWFS